MRRYRSVLIVCAVVQLLYGCAGGQYRRGDILRLEDGTVFVGEPADSGAVQEALLAQFREWQGTPYLLGGNSMSGVDCSAFVQQTLSTHFNITVPRSTNQQVQVGMPVDRGNLKVGDLVFFRTGYSSNHVGIYLGSRQFLHASTRSGVTISNLDSLYWRKTFWQIRRVM